MDPITLLLEMPEVDLNAIFEAIPEKIDSSCQRTEDASFSGVVLSGEMEKKSPGKPASNTPA